MPARAHTRGAAMSRVPGVARAETTRSRLYDAAVRAFADKGFHGTTTREIAAASGMSAAALYVHHRSKEELLFVISRQGHESTLQLIRAAISSTADPAEGLRRAIHDFAMHHANEPTVARIVNYELDALVPEHLREIRGIRRDIEGEVRRVVVRGVRAGCFVVADAELSAAALLSLGVDLARWYRSGGRWTPEQIAEQYAELALRMVGATH